MPRPPPHPPPRPSPCPPLHPSTSGPAERPAECPAESESPSECPAESHAKSRAAPPIASPAAHRRVPRHDPLRVPPAPPITALVAAALAAARKREKEPGRRGSLPGDAITREASAGPNEGAPQKAVPAKRGGCRRPRAPREGAWVEIRPLRRGDRQILGGSVSWRSGDRGNGGASSAE